MCATATLQAGFAEVDITPLRGVELAGHSFGPAQRVLHPLRARCACFHDGNEGALVFALDLLALGDALAHRIRNALETALGVPADAILLTCTHTHAGPATAYLGSWGRIDPDYVEELKRRLVAVAREAHGRLAPVHLRAATTEGPRVAVNRCRGENLPVNRNLTVVGAEDLTGKPRAVWVNFACHPVNLHGSGAFSPDFPHYVTTAMSRADNVPTFYFSGASGDLNPANFAPGNASPERAQATGEPVAKAAQALRDELTAIPDGPLRHTRVDVTVGLQPLPPREEIAAYRDEARDVIAELDSLGPEDETYCRYKTRYDWAVRALAERDTGQPQETTTVAVWGLAIGGLRMLGLPGELFSRYELALREQASGYPLLVATTTNGCRGYFPDPAAYDREAYEALFSTRILGTYAYQRDVGVRMLAGCRDALAALA